MSQRAIAIRQMGLVTSVGLSAPQSCAALRAKITNPTETRFIGNGGKWIMAHQVELERPWRGLTKLAKMAAMAIDEALQGLADAERARLPLLLCVAEPERPGRMAGLDDQLFKMIEAELGIVFSTQSAVVPHGRVAAAVAMLQARTLIDNGRLPGVLVAATDSLLSWQTLSHYEREGRLLSEQNSNGFLPGEGAGALLVGPFRAGSAELACTGIGFGIEPARIDSDDPSRADGLTQAITNCMEDAGCRMHDMDFRITDLSGEQYYFKEAALALTRTLRQLKSEFDIWHPAECIGEAGALAGVSVIANAADACAKGYAKGMNVLAHWGADSGRRSAMTLNGGAVR